MIETSHVMFQQKSSLELKFFFSLDHVAYPEKLATSAISELRLVRLYGTQTAADR
jgi:hypothetical protein